MCHATRSKWLCFGWLEEADALLDWFCVRIAFSYIKMRVNSNHELSITRLTRTIDTHTASSQMCAFSGAKWNLCDCVGKETRMETRDQKARQRLQRKLAARSGSSAVDAPTLSSPSASMDPVSELLRLGVEDPALLQMAQLVAGERNPHALRSLLSNVTRWGEEQMIKEEEDGEDEDDEEGPPPSSPPP
eukprot:scaffold145213_cov31-Tisochrysis_lutea.AAC.8